MQRSGTSFKTTNALKMSDVPMYPQPPSNEDGFFGRSEPDFDQEFPGEGEEVDKNSWLLDEGAADAEASEGAPSFESVQPLPGEFNERLDTIEAFGPDGDGVIEGDVAGFDPDHPEDSLDAFAEGLTKTDPMVGASFVEPEPATRAFSRALVPAGAALLISFCGIAVWAFMKKPVTDANPTDIQVASPDVVDSLEGNDVDMVTPLGVDESSSTGRISFQRDGSTKVIGGNGAPSATVKSPREPGELPSGGDSGQPSFSAFGSTGSAVNPKDSVEVEEAPEGFGGNAMVDAREFNASLDQGVTDETLDTFGALEDDVFLPQEFMDSFVLSIDPIEDVASIYGDIDTREEMDSFADLDFALSEPFDSQGFGDFSVSQWEGIGEDSVLADAEVEQEYEVFLPFGMFNDEDDEDLVASVEVGPELSVTAVATEMEQLPSDPMEDATEVAQETVVDETADGNIDGASTEDPLLALFGLPEGAESAPVEVAPIEGEAVANVTEEVTLEPAEEVSTEAVEEFTGNVNEVVAEVTEMEVLEPEATEFEATESEATELEIVEPNWVEMEVAVVAPLEAEPVAAEPMDVEVNEPMVAELTEEVPVEEVSVEEVPVELVAEAEIPVVEFESELQSDLDIAAAHARLDSMFGAPMTEEVAAVEEPQLELEPEVLVAEEAPIEVDADPLSTELAVELEEVALVAEVEEEPSMAPGLVAETIVVEAPAEVLVAEVEVEVAPLEPVAEVIEEAPIEEAPIEVAAETTEAPEVEVLELAGATAEPSSVEVLESVVDEAGTTRFASALRRNASQNVWVNRTVPKSKIAGDTFILTPNVGNVRIIFDGGESIDGRLHGVGAQKIILDTKLGRMTLDARRADRIDRLGGGKRAELRSPSDSYSSTKGLDRVKVRAAGGVFYGYLVAQTDDKVTLMLDDGVRVTLDSTEVETSKARKSTSRLQGR